MVEPPDETATLRRELIETAWQLGLELRNRGATAEARRPPGARALRYDPDNFVIRKQIWALLHPERFTEPIDYAWQQEQLAPRARRRVRRVRTGRLCTTIHFCVVPSV